MWFIIAFDRATIFLGNFFGMFRANFFVCTTENLRKLKENLGEFNKISGKIFSSTPEKLSEVLDNLRKCRKISCKFFACARRI